MKIIYETIFGSKMYGLDNPNSDDDFRGVFLPAAEDILLSKVKDTIESSTGVDYKRNQSGDIDRTLYSLRKYVELLCNGDTGALDMIHSPQNKWLTSNPIWDYLHQHRSEFYTSNLTGLFEYVRQQAAKYGIRGYRVAALREVLDIVNALDDSQHDLKVRDIHHLFPLNEFCRFVEDKNQRAGHQEFYEVLDRRYQFSISVKMFKDQIIKLWASYGERAKLAESNDGVDWKALSHALRSGYQLRDIYTLGDYQYPLRESKYIIEVKEGSVPFIQVKESLEELVVEIEKLAAVSKYPKVPDVKKWEKWVMEIYQNSINEEMK